MNTVSFCKDSTIAFAKILAKILAKSPVLGVPSRLEVLTNGNLLFEWLNPTTDLHPSVKFLIHAPFYVNRFAEVTPAGRVWIMGMVGNKYVHKTVQLSTDGLSALP